MVKRKVWCGVCALIAILVIGGSASGADISWVGKDETTGPYYWYYVYGDYYGTPGYWFHGADVMNGYPPMPTGYPTLGATTGAYEPPDWLSSFRVFEERPPLEGIQIYPCDVWYPMEISEELPGGATHVEFELTILFYDVEYWGDSAKVIVGSEAPQVIDVADFHRGTYYSWHITAAAGEEIIVKLELDGSTQTYAAAFFIDEFTYVPEPATVSIMGLGSLYMLLLRRRKCK